jgi:hypothetical protein
MAGHIERMGDEFVFSEKTRRQKVTLETNALLGELY